MSIINTVESIENPDHIQTFDFPYGLKEQSSDIASDALGQKGFVEFGKEFIEKHLPAFQELAK